MACIMEMRKEYQRTNQIPKMHQYFRAYNIGIIANRLIEPLIIAPTNPTIGDIMSLRSKVNKEIKLAQDKAFIPHNKDSLISQLRIIKTQLQQFGIDVEIKLTRTVKQITMI